MKHFSEMEDLFRPAKQGDNVAYKQLYDAYIKEGLAVFKSFCFNMLIYSMYVDDVFLMLSELFMKIMKKYHYRDGKFVTYAMVSLKRAITNFFIREMKKPNEIPLSLDSPTEDGGTLLDEIPADDYRSEATRIATKESMYKIASKSKSKNKLESKVGKILLYRLSGYSYPEICERLEITEGQLRFLIAKIKQDDDFSQLKIDLK